MQFFRSKRKKWVAAPLEERVQRLERLSSERQRSARSLEGACTAPVVSNESLQAQGATDKVPIRPEDRHAQPQRQRAKPVPGLSVHRDGAHNDLPELSIPPRGNTPRDELIAPTSALASARPNRVGSARPSARRVSYQDEKVVRNSPGRGGATDLHKLQCVGKSALDPKGNLSARCRHAAQTSEPEQQSGRPPAARAQGSPRQSRSASARASHTHRLPSPTRLPPPLQQSPRASAQRMRVEL